MAHFMAAHFVRWQWSQRCLLDAWELASVPVSLLSKRHNLFRQIRRLATQRAPALRESCQPLGGCLLAVLTFRLILHWLDNALVVQIYRSIAVAVTRRESCKDSSAV